jgi:hypothetical protein
MIQEICRKEVMRTAPKRKELPYTFWEGKSHCYLLVEPVVYCCCFHLGTHLPLLPSALGAEAGGAGEGD